MGTELKSVVAATLMNRNVKTLREDMLLAEAIDYLLAHRVSCAPVVTEGSGGRLIVVGFLTEKDCIDRIADEFYYGSPRPIQTVQTTMRRHPLCVAPEMDIFSLVSFFVSHGLRHAPVTEEDGHLLGMLSRRDILKTLNQSYDKEMKSWQLEHFPPDMRQVANLRYFKK